MPNGFICVLLFDFPNELNPPLLLLVPPKPVVLFPNPVKPVLYWELVVV